MSMRDGCPLSQCRVYQDTSLFSKVIIASRCCEEIAKMKLSYCAAAFLMLLPLEAIAGNCYFCQNGHKVGAVYPTYKCGKKCHKKHYDTTFSTYHCWKDGRNPTCFKNCCKKAGRDVGVLRGL
ncbi:hypothetical protein DIZ76_014510 [Coccidioides immitis]|nr:hypothetical protein DIZ76_014510 [Coccidioides immitis]